MDLIDKLKAAVEDFRDNRVSTGSMTLMALGILAIAGLCGIAGRIAQ